MLLLLLRCSTVCLIVRGTTVSCLWLDGQRDCGVVSPPGFKSRCSHLFLKLFQDFRRCAFSERGRSRRRRGAYGNFVNLKMIYQLSLSEVLISQGVRVYVHMSECMRVYMSACVCIDAQKKNPSINSNRRLVNIIRSFLHLLDPDCD